MLKRLINRRISLLAVIVLVAARNVPAQTDLFFTEYKFNDPKIRGIDLDGTNLRELFTLNTAE